MMRLPRFRYVAPASIEEAVSILADHGPEAMPVAGGTDLLPNMKRRQQTPRVLVGLRRLEALRGAVQDGDGFALGAGVTLAELVELEQVRRHYPGLWQAAVQVATPHLRQMGTLGGNLCLDTRCNYYDQSYEWRKAIGFCMKKDGHICWVANSSPRCLAVSSTDTAPALIALGARVVLRGPEGEREIPLTELYENDGIHYLRKRREELLARVRLGPAGGWRSTYWKLRRRGAFDFPVLGVAVAARFAAQGVVEQARIVLGAVAMRPVEAAEAAGALAGKPLTDAVIEQAASLAFKVAKPMDNTDFTLHWRKRLSRELVTYALRELRGDDMRQTRRRLARWSLGLAA